MSAILLPDIAAARQFLDLLDPSGDFAFATFDDKKVTPKLARRFKGSLSDYAPDLAALNAAGAGVFVTINSTDDRGYRAGNVNSVRAVFVDLDGAALGPVESWSLPPHMVVGTSPGRWHAYWLVQDFPLSMFKSIQRALAARFGGDESVSDLGRVMRLPGFMHQKVDAIPVEVIKIRNDLARYEAKQIANALQLDEEVRPYEGAAAPTIPDGERNITLTRIAGRHLRAGLPVSAILEELLRINAEQCSPPLDDDEVMSIAKNIAKYSVSSATVPSGYGTTDTGNAQRFVVQNRDDSKFVPEQGKWLLWKGNHWQFDLSGEIVERAKKTAKSILTEAAEIDSESVRNAVIKHARQSLNRPRLQAMVSLASTDREMLLHVNQIDADDYLLGVQNGAVDLRDGSFRPSNRFDFVTRRSKARFDERAECPTFIRFIERVTGGSADLQEYLQRLVGYTLTGSTREHIFAFLYGHGANGKSTFLDVVMNLLGEYATQTQPETLMARRGNGASSDLARLVGKRVVITNEVGEGAHFEENLLKQLVGGDVVTARFLYQEHFEFKPKFKLLIAGNHKPVIMGDDEGVWRRVHLVPFVHTIPEAERDKRLGEKLAAELPGILNWAIAGCLAWQASGLNAPAIITDATARYRDEMDLLGNWIEQECDTNAGLRYSSRKLYENYRKWCEDGGIKPLSVMVFVRKLESRSFPREHTRAGNVIVGLQLRDKLASALGIAA